MAFYENKSTSSPSCEGCEGHCVADPRSFTGSHGIKPLYSQDIQIDPSFDTGGWLGDFNYPDSVVRNLLDGVIVLDVDGKVMAMNHNCCKLLGYGIQELEGKGILSLISSYGASSDVKFIQEHLCAQVDVNTGQERQTIKLRRKYRQDIDAELSIFEIILTRGRGYMCFIHDVSSYLDYGRSLCSQKEGLSIQTRINHIIQEVDRPEKLLREVLETLISLPSLNVQRKVGVFLVDREQNKGSKSLSRPETGNGRKGLRLAMTVGGLGQTFLEKESWVPLGQCLCGRAALTGEVLVSQNCFEDPRHENTYKGITAHGHYIVPIKNHKDVLGVIFLYTDPDPPWDQHRAVLFETLGIQIGMALDRIWTVQELNKSRDQLYHMAMNDPLTGLQNRRSTENRLSQEWSRAERESRPLGIIMMDIDHFKKVNDTYGHQCGDDVLAALARILKSSVRESDVIGRYGGEEFIVLLPGAALDEAARVAEKIRSELEKAPLTTREGKIAVTGSFGVSSTKGGAERYPVYSYEMLVERADVALYKAKKTGRNKVEMADALA